MGRATIFLSLLSAALIGLGFVSGTGALVRPYLGAVLPTLVVAGVLTFLRLVQNTVENEVDPERMQPVRASTAQNSAGSRPRAVTSVRLAASRSR